MFSLLSRVYLPLSQLAEGSGAPVEPQAGLELGSIAHLNEPGHTKHTPSSSTFYSVSEGSSPA